MGRFGWALPMAGLAISVGGMIGGALSGQSSEIVTPGEPSAVELLAPEFEPSAEIGFPTPDLAWPASASSDLPVIAPLVESPPPALPRAGTWPVVVPGPTFFPGEYRLESKVILRERPQTPLPPVDLSEPDRLKSLPQPIFEASLHPIPSAPGAPEACDLPPLPNPTLFGPGHSRAMVSEFPRPGHSAPKRLSESAPGFRAW